MSKRTSLFGEEPRMMRRAEHEVDRTARLTAPWPRLMCAKKAAAYVDERSVEAFRRGIPKLYPEPVKISGKGERWLKEALDDAIDRLTGQVPSIKNAADVL